VNTTDIAKLLAGRSSRRLSANTSVRREADGSFVLRLHSTDVLTEDAAGNVTVRTGGWFSATTKSRVNEHLAAGLPRLFQKARLWYWSIPSFASPVTFLDGDTVTPDGRVLRAEPRY